MICGVDEAGRGPVIGPMVIAGVMLKSESQLDGLNVRDSKKCTPKRREKLALEIEKIARTEVIIVPARDIDTLRERLTLNKIESDLFASIIEKLRPSTAYVDSADVNVETFRRNIEDELSYEVEIISKHGADEIYPIVSAASIIAKTTRDAEIRKIAEELGEGIGSGYPSDAVTMQFLESWVESHGTPPPYTRLSWKTTQRLLSRLKSKKIEDF